MSFKIDLSQLTELSAQLSRYGAHVKEDVAMAGVAEMAVVIYDEVKVNVAKHKKTGLLSSAIYRVYSPEKSLGALKLYRVSWNKRKAPHGHLLENGTSRAPAYPFLRPSLSRLSEAIRAGRARIAAKLLEMDGQP